MDNFKKYIFILIVLLVSSMSAYCQVAPNKYWVKFTDKSNSGFSVDNPIEYLSQRAIERRMRQNISIDISDIPVDQNYIDQVLDIGNIVFLNKSKWLNAIIIETADSNALIEIGNLPFVSIVKSAKQIRGKKSVKYLSLNNKQEKSSNDYYEELYGASFNQISMLNGHLLHDAGFKGEGMLIAVLDGGFQFANTTLALQPIFNSGNIVATKDFTTGDDFVYESSTHGTAVLSCMAGNLPNNIYGTAPNAKYVLLKSEEVSSEFIVEEYNYVAAAEYADSIGADVINSSLGYTEYDDVSTNHTYGDMDGNTTVVTNGADKAASKGILVVSSAGNSGNNPWHFISAPSDGDSVLCIGAVDALEVHANFSSFGPSADGRIKPNVVAQGRASVVCDDSASVKTANGTSFSSPILAGMAATLWGAHPTATNMEIFYAIEKSAHLFSNPNDSLGQGIPNFMMAHEYLTLYLGAKETNNTSDVITFELFPNPTSNDVYMKYYPSKSGTVTIEIFDSKGSIVYDKNEYFNSFLHYYNFNNVFNSIPSGIYYVQLTFNGSKYLKKVSKI
jgi:serine protease AprX